MVPMKEGKGICEVDNFCGIAVVSVVYKLMCSMVQGRLVQIVEGEHLLAEEQGGGWRGRGYRDQILMLTLLGQMKMVTRKRGMFAAFIDFQNASDSVDRNKLEMPGRLGSAGEFGGVPEGSLCRSEL